MADHENESSEFFVSNVYFGTCNVHETRTSQSTTTPAKEKLRVRNPFEHALAERLHLPIIGSPSLFQIPQTPQMSSTQFEWTIDDVSSLKPVHLEPHETQFQDSPDPEFEAKAQSAISSYFKDQIIVPSPIACPLRHQRILLSELNAATPVAKQNSLSFSIHKQKIVRHAFTQTELALPAVLPPDLEAILSAYSQKDRCSSIYSDDFSFYQRQTPLKEAKTEYVNKDASLRRKLFDKHSLTLLDGNDVPQDIYKFDTSLPNPPACSSPTSGVLFQRTTIAGKLLDSTDNSSVCSLSPLSALYNLSSPDTDHTETKKTNLSQCAYLNKYKSKRKAPDFKEMPDVEDLSPISKPSRRLTLNGKRHKTSNFSAYRTSPDVSSNLSIKSHLTNKSSIELSILSSRKTEDTNLSLTKEVQALMMADSLPAPYDDQTCEKFDEATPSHLNYSPVNNNPQNSDTPRGAKRGAAKRTNLSESLSNINPYDDADKECTLDSLDGSNDTNAIDDDKCLIRQTKDIIKVQQLGAITRDSGFNECCLKAQANSQNHLMCQHKVKDSEVNL